MQRTVKLLGITNIVVYTFVCLSQFAFLAMVLSKKGLNIPSRQVFGLTMIGFNGLLAASIAGFGIGLICLSSVSVRWTRRLAWVRICTLTYSTIKTTAALVSLLLLPDRDVVFKTLFSGLGVTVLLSLAEGGYLWFLLRKLALYERWTIEAEEERAQDSTN